MISFKGSHLEMNKLKNLPIGAVSWKIYTESKQGLFDVVARYFPNATFTYGDGMFEHELEAACVIEIIGDYDDMQTIVHLCGDIREKFKQQEVLFTRQEVHAFIIMEDKNEAPR